MKADRTITDKYLESSFEFLRILETEQQFIVASDFPTIHGMSVTIRGEERGFSFETTRMNSVPEGAATYQHQGYGFTEPFFLLGKNQKVFLPIGLSKMEMTFSTGKITGLIHQLDSEYYFNYHCYHRFIVPQNMHHGTMARHVESDRLRVGEWTTGAGFINVSVDSNIYHLFYYTYHNHKGTKQPYYFIDSTTPVLSDAFEKAVDSIIHSIAFITGELPRDEAYILQSDDLNFQNVTGARFRRGKGSVDTQLEVVAPTIMRELNIGKEYSGYVSQQVLSTIATRAYTDVRMLRALKIVVESGLYPLEIRGATYSVALETLKNIILESKSDIVNPIKSKADARKIIKSLKAVIADTSDEMYNNKKIVFSKIEMINQPANSSGFLACFEQLGVTLDESDSAILNNRNDFLHGRLPFEDESKANEGQDLRFIVYKYHFLLSILVLKFCGYFGPIKDNAKFYNLISQRVRVRSNELFKTI